MTLIMERAELLAGEAVGLDVWIENPTDTGMTNVRFRYAGPSFLAVGRLASDGKCRVEANGIIPLGSIQPNSILEPSPRLCLQANSKVEEHDLFLGFSVSYSLDNQSKSRVLIVEKKLSIGLFGTETIGGVSLRLAAYVVPGLLLMMVLRVGGLPSVGNLGGSEVATLSVLFSVLLFLIAARIPGFNLTFAGVGSAVSAELFLALCATAIAVGCLMLVIQHCIKVHRERQRNEFMVGATDNYVTALQKALRGATRDTLPVTVITRNQERFVGSLMAPTSSGGTALLGWFQLRLASNDQLREQLDGLIQKKQLSTALELALQHHIEPEMRNPVRELLPDGTLDLTTDEIKRFRDRDILESSMHAIGELEDGGPLVLATP
jgi:hypothetical protein